MLVALALCAIPAAAATPPGVALSPYVRIAPSAVKLRGYVNPHGEEATYYFEYGTASCDGGGGCASVPAGQDAVAGSGSEATPVAQQVTGLQPDTTYHYRLLASSSKGSSATTDTTFTTPREPAPEAPGACPNEAIREAQGVVGVLPECRAYELVSRIPAAIRANIDVGASTERTRAAAGGDALEFLSTKATSDSPSLPAAMEYMATRGGDGWLVHPIIPKQKTTFVTESIASATPQYSYISTDLSKGVLRSNAQLSDEGANIASLRNLYLRDDLLDPEGGSYQLLNHSAFPQWSGEPQYGPETIFAAASADLSHVLFESELDLTAESQGLSEGMRLYEWVAGEGVSFAGILPASEGGGPVRSRAGRGNRYYTERTMSSDGSRFVFTVPTNEAFKLGSASGGLYLREDEGTPDPSDDQTVLVSATEKTNGAGPGGSDSAGTQAATFWTATPSLSQIFFTSGEALTDDAPEGEPKTQKLYRYEPGAPVGHKLTLISVDSEPADGAGDEALGAIGASDDGSYVYFVSRNQLQSGGPTTSMPRIFVWHEGSVREVAGIDDGEELKLILGSRRVGDWGPDIRTSRVSPDGRRLLFVSQGSSELTGYDSGSSCPEWESPSCSEAYVYEASPDGPGDLQCASCNPKGMPATSNADVSPRGPEVIFFSGGTYVNRALADDGRFVFFDSADQLVPADHDEEEDAYAFDTVTDEVHLLSSHSDGASFFLDASADGSDAFFVTRAGLVPEDDNGLRDVYDARVDGGFAAAPPPAPPCASASECRPAAAGAPAEPAGTASETDPGASAPVAKRHLKKHRRRARRGHGRAGKSSRRAERGGGAHG
jgi:hypothetical protein